MVEWDQLQDACDSFHAGETSMVVGGAPLWGSDEFPQVEQNAVSQCWSVYCTGMGTECREETGPFVRDISYPITTATRGALIGPFTTV